VSKVPFLVFKVPILVFKVPIPVFKVPFLMYILPFPETGDRSGGFPLMSKIYLEDT
jgi:hypothetical protein